MSRRRKISLYVLSAFMTLAGLNHFLNPGPYVAMMPVEVPHHLLMVYLSGVAEMAGGLGLLLPQTRRLAAWGLVVLFVAIFPANFNMAWNGLPLGDREVAPALLWARLPIQGLLIYWAWTFTRREPRPA